MSYRGTASEPSEHEHAESLIMLDFSGDCSDANYPVVHHFEI